MQERRAAWLAPLEAEGLARRVVLRARTDAVVWLVSPGPLELGLALHHLYGFPVLPGSSLKGLARRSAGDGAATRYGTQGSVAPVAILDGLPCEGWRIQRDVMTPHFADWYQQQPGRRPDDTDDPIPIPFLSIAAGSAFEVALLARDLEAEQSLDGVIEDLRRGLDERGLGAKTAAGYGVFAVEVLPAGRQLASVGREEAIIVPATAPVATPAPAGRSPEAIALSQAITSLKSAEVKPRLQSLAEQIQHCPVEDRAALVQHLRERLRELGFKQKEIREFSKRHPVLRFSEDQ